MKRFLCFAWVFIFSATCFAGPLWHCIANNEQGAVWNQYADTREAARNVVERACEPHNGHTYCPLVCFPPRVYYRCLSHDTVPAQSKAGTWYWTSFSKQVAINGARDACRHNSAFGGCYVDPKACATSQEEK